MTINNISGVNSVKGCSGIEKSAKAVKLPEQDTITLSSEAKAMGEVFAISEELNAVPDIRMDKVEAAIQHLKDPMFRQTVIFIGCSAETQGIDLIKYTFFIPHIM